MVKKRQTKKTKAKKNIPKKISIEKEFKNLEDALLKYLTSVIHASKNDPKSYKKIRPHIMKAAKTFDKLHLKVKKTKRSKK